MINTVIIIVVSVSIFGGLFFFYVKNALKKRLNFYLDKNNRKNEARVFFHQPNHAKSHGKKC